MNLQSSARVLLMLASALVSPVIGCGPSDEQDRNDTTKEELGVTSQGIAYGGHDYLFVTTPKTWPEAQAHCSINGYKLVTINDANEKAFLAAHEFSFTPEMRVGDHFILRRSSWWIGLNDRGSEGFFVWDGAPSPYTNWKAGEPDNGGPTGDQDCVASIIELLSSGQWADYSCEDKRNFICERDSLPVSSKGKFEYSASNTSNATVNTSNRSVYLYAGQLFTVGTCGLPGASGVGNTYLRVNNPSGQEIAANDNAGGSCGDLSSISFIVPMTGSYTLRAGCSGNTNCNGTVAFNY